MFLQKLDRVSQSGESLHSLVFDLGNISEMSHNLSQKLFVACCGQISRQLLDATADFFDEVLDVVQLLGCVLIQVAGETINPVVDDRLELFDERLGVNLQPTDVGRGLHASNSCFVFVKLGNLSIEDIEGGLFGSNSVQHFHGHGIKVLDF